MDTSNIDLLAVIAMGKELKRVASTQGGEYHGPCPFCGGRDRFSVQVNRNGRGGRWSCRQCSPSWQDAIAFVQRRDGVSFKEACRILGLDLQNGSGKPHQMTRRTQNRSSVRQKNNSKRNPVDAPALISEHWQEAAEDFVSYCQEILWTRKGKVTRIQLRDRGLSDAVIEDAGLGYNPTTCRDDPGCWGFDADGKDIWLPKGIVIPWWIRDTLWRINIRQPKREPKYIVPRGSANGLYNADDISLRSTVVMVEGEFDALSLMPLRDRLDIVPVATGSATGSRLRKWEMRVALADQVLLAFDDDDAGEQAAKWWHQKLGSKAMRLCPLRHDVNDMLREGDDLVAWLEKGLHKISHFST